jgi:hypothetical protein
MKKIVRLTENDLTRIVKKVIREDDNYRQHQHDYPEPYNNGNGVAGGVKVEFRKDTGHHLKNAWFISRNEDTPGMYDEVDFFTEEEVAKVTQALKDGGIEVDESMTDMGEPTTLFVIGDVEGFFGSGVQPQMNKRPRIGSQMGKGLSKHILDTYVSAIEDEIDMNDFGDDFEYYDNVIGWAVEKYIEAEEPEREDDWDYRDQLDDDLKNYWMPI